LNVSRSGVGGECSNTNSAYLSHSHCQSPISHEFSLLNKGIEEIQSENTRDVSIEGGEESSKRKKELNSDNVNSPTKKMARLTVEVSHDQYNPMEISFPSPNSEVSFPLLEKSLQSTGNGDIVSLPPGQASPSTPLNIPNDMCSQMTQFDCEGSPVRNKPSASRVQYHKSPVKSDSEQSQTYFTPPGSPTSQKSTDENEGLLINHPTDDVATDNENVTRVVTPLASLNSYRSHLMVTCPTLISIPRVDCSTVVSSSPGMYRLLCVINKVVEDEPVRGVCHQCGKTGRLEKFEKIGNHIVCCSRGRVKRMAEKEFFLTLDVRDYSGSLNLSVKGKEAEYFLSCDIKQFAVDSTARKLVMTKLNNLIKAIADLGVVKEAAGDYTICSSIIK